MDRTENLHFPYLMPSQAQKHVTINETLRALDAILHLSVASRSDIAPPSTPEPGSRYLIPEHATGEWAGREKQIAAWQDGVWIFHPPRAGWIAHVSDEQLLLVFDGTDWDSTAFGSQLPARLGLNTTAEAPNRLALAGDASLFTHEGTGHQLKINKAGVEHNASVLFQTDWSGRAEFGLAGDDNFHVKVSADGTAFTEAMVIDGATGITSFPAGVAGMREQLTADRTYYVASTGSDDNSGLSPASPFATLQKAVDEAHKLDCSVHHVTVSMANGIYPGGYISRPLLGGSKLRIIGNETMPANVTLSSPLLVIDNALVQISGVRFAPSGSGQYALSVREGATVLLGAVDFGTCMDGRQVNAERHSRVIFEQDYKISGGAMLHFSAITGAIISGANLSVILTGSPVFTGEFAHASGTGIIDYWNLTIDGTATGKRYSVSANGVINLYGKPENFLPGDISGSTDTGGIYT